jgi:hypothetical protein
MAGNAAPTTSAVSSALPASRRPIAAAINSCNLRTAELSATRPSHPPGEWPTSANERYMGAANFSASGLKRQGNDLIVKDAQAAAKLKHAFEPRFASSKDFPIDGR